MGKLGARGKRVLEVHVVHEPSRLEGECVALAYERVVPVVRRALRGIPGPSQAQQGVAAGRIGGASA